MLRLCRRDAWEGVSEFDGVGTAVDFGAKTDGGAGVMGRGVEREAEADDALGCLVDRFLGAMRMPRSSQLEHEGTKEQKKWKWAGFFAQLHDRGMNGDGTTADDDERRGVQSLDVRTSESSSLCSREIVGT